MCHRRDRAAHAAVLLANGKVLIAGGNQSTTSGVATSLASAEIFDPGTGTFTTTGTLGQSRDALIFTGITRLNDGRVLVVGGFAGRSAELFDPVGSTFSGTGSTSVPHTAGSATLLADGRVLVAGGHGSATTAVAEIYNPSTGTFTAAVSLTVPRQEHSATRLGDGRVLLVDGFDSAISSDRSSAELFSLASPPVIP